MAENEPKIEGEPPKPAPRRKQSIEDLPLNTQKKISKVPVVKKAKLLPKNESRHKHLALGRENSIVDDEEKKWNDSKIFILPLMPTDDDEKKFSSGEYRCAYCYELCDQSNLECKVCFKIAHISCLYKRGYLETEFVPQKTDWACADCSDLTKCLTDDEMRKIINVFDQLDFKKNCFVKLEDYLKVKRKICEEDGGLMTPEAEQEEKRRFNLMDLDKSGSITWNEYVDFETANLLSKKNKVELSNHLSKKELIVAKRKFLSYDKEKMKMINKEDAKSCYMEYIMKLKEKLGAPMEDHIGNCAELFGLRQNSENQTSLFRGRVFEDLPSHPGDEDLFFKNCRIILKCTAKTMWPEFVRKITLLLLYDRLNSQNFRPRYWKPGNWFIQSEKVYEKEHNEAGPSTNRANSSGRKMSSDKTQKPNFFINDNSDKDKQSDEKNKLLEINALMNNNLDIDSFKPYNYSEFGSFNYVIRSRNYNGGKSGEEQEEQFLKFKPNKINLGPIQRNKPNPETTTDTQLQQQLNSTSFNLQNLKLTDKKSIKQPKSDSIENLLQNHHTSSNLKLGKLPNNLEGSSEVLNLGENTQRTLTDYDYSKVTDDIYKAFGKQKQSKYSYPQKITVVKTSRSHKQVPEPINHEDYLFNDLIENTNYTKSIIGSKGEFFGPNQRSMIVEKNLNSAMNSANPTRYRDGSTRLVPLESSRIDSRSINGGATSNMSSATNFSQARNNKLMKILGEY